MWGLFENESSLDGNFQKATNKPVMHSVPPLVTRVTLITQGSLIDSPIYTPFGVAGDNPASNRRNSNPRYEGVLSLPPTSPPTTDKSSVSRAKKTIQYRL